MSYNIFYGKFPVEDHFRDNGLSEHDHTRKGKTKKTRNLMHLVK